MKDEKNVRKFYMNYNIKSILIYNLTVLEKMPGSASFILFFHSLFPNVML